MKKDTWTWSIGYHSDKGHFVTLSQHTLWDEVLSALGVWLWGRRFGYSLGTMLFNRAIRVQEDVMEMPITYEQAKKLGWWSDDE